MSNTVPKLNMPHSYSLPTINTKKPIDRGAINRLGSSGVGTWISSETNLKNLKKTNEKAYTTNVMKIDNHFQRVYEKKQKQMMNFQMNHSRWDCLNKFFIAVGGRRGTKWQHYYTRLYHIAPDGEINLVKFICVTQNVYRNLSPEITDMLPKLYTSFNYYNLPTMDFRMLICMLYLLENPNVNINQLFDKFFVIYASEGILPVRNEVCKNHINNFDLIKIFTVFASNTYQLETLEDFIYDTLDKVNPMTFRGRKKINMRLFQTLMKTEEFEERIIGKEIDTKFISSIESLLPRPFQSYLINARKRYKELKELNINFEIQRKMMIHECIGRWKYIVKNRRKLRRAYKNICKYNRLLILNKWRSEVVKYYYAVKIEKIFRGYYYGRKTDIDKRRMIIMSTRIQAVFRGYIARVRFKEINRRRLKAAIIIEKYLRMFIARIHYKKMEIQHWQSLFKENAIKLQKQKEIRKNNAILTIQCFWRCIKAKRIVQSKRGIGTNSADLAKWKEEKQQAKTLADRRKLFQAKFDIQLKREEEAKQRELEEKWEKYFTEKLPARRERIKKEREELDREMEEFKLKQQTEDKNRYNEWLQSTKKPLQEVKMEILDLLKAQNLEGYDLMKQKEVQTLINNNANILFEDLTARGKKVKLENAITQATDDYINKQMAIKLKELREEFEQAEKNRKELTDEEKLFKNTAIFKQRQMKIWLCTALQKIWRGYVVRKKVVEELRQYIFKDYNEETKNIEYYNTKTRKYRHIKPLTFGRVFDCNYRNKWYQRHDNVLNVDYFYNYSGPKISFDIPKDCIMCGSCKKEFAKKSCANCGDSFCIKCSEEIHKNGSSQMHRIVDFSGDCPMNWIEEGFCNQCKRCPASYICMKPLHVSLCKRKICSVCYLHPINIWKGHKCIWQYIPGSLDLIKPKVK